MTDEQLLEQVEEEVKRFVRQPESGPLQHDVDLRELGVDSVRAVDLLLALELRFSVLFPDHLINPETFRSLGALAAVLKQLRSD